MTVHVIILAAGDGKRFQVEGEPRVSKPLVKFVGETLIERAVNFWGCSKTIVNVVCHVGVAWVVRENQFLNGLSEVIYTQPGPGMSALLLGGGIPEDSEVIIADCDNVFLERGVLPTSARELIDEVSLCNADVVVAYTHLRDDENTSQYCNLWLRKVGGGHYIINNITEKAVNCPVREAGVGIYYFKRWSTFRKAACGKFALLDEGRELSMSTVVRHMMTHGKHRIVGLPVPRRNWYNCGTPEELAKSEETYARLINPEKDPR